MRINCPWCGPRPLDEFDYYGDASKRRPKGKRQDDMNAWTDYIYTRENPAGAHREYWQHSSGCRSWLIATRDTTTHEISKVVLARPAAGGGKW